MSVTVDVIGGVTAEIDVVVGPTATVEVIGGTPGPPGPAGGSYTHTQSTPSMTWVIDHGLDYAPNVTVVDSSGRQVEGDVAYSLGQVIVTFSAAFSGRAYLS